MGLHPGWASGDSSPETVDTEAIAAEMREVVEQWFGGHIRIYEEAEQRTAYDPIADTGGQTPSTLLYDSGPKGALIQPIRGAAPIEFGEQSTMIHSIRFQVVRRVPPEALRGGLTIHVVDGGNAPELTVPRFTLKHGYDSSIAWHRILEAVTVGGGS